jgi:hypothetical protein
MNLLKQTVPLEKFLPHVLAFAIGDERTGALPDSAALSFIRNAAFTFAERTGILTQNIKVDLQCGLSEYPLDLSSCDTIIGVKHARFGDFETEGCGCFWSWGGVDFTFDDDVLSIYPAPTRDVEDGLDLTVIVAPNKDSCDIDATLYNKWHDAIVNGALSEIHLMTNQPWSSVSRADYRRRLFEEAISRATIRKVMKGRREPLHVSGNPDWFKCRTSQRRW